MSEEITTEQDSSILEPSTTNSEGSASILPSSEGDTNSLSDASSGEGDGKANKGIPIKKGRPLLHKLETIIEKGYKEFWAVGEALFAIKEQNLFSKRYSGEDYESFSDYLEARWGYRSRGYQIMQASKIRRLMIDELGIKDPDSICPSERQFRQNAGLLKLEEAGKLSELKDIIPDKKALNAASFREAVECVLPPRDPKLKSASASKPEVQRRKLEKKLAGIRKGIEAKLASLQAKYPELADVFDGWRKSFAESQDGV